ncbi:hypothetical protein PsYK624_070900 [Phanerochaete sordida]|uniref:Uncharacterized protein n=1 Tax=Phanerochaete sordida TaxID=48140 RepID=A0A9P3LDZ9_9APHY|nr:hypothetical protein PsYK624_070900 [Phanerochaete sordida]
MDQQHSKTSRPSLPQDDSSGSLNINELVTHKFDNLLTTSLSSLPTLSGALSFSDVPDFPRDKCSPPLFVNLTRTPTLSCPGSQSLCHPSEVTISVPTTSRMQMMLLEPISVTRWSDRNTAFASNCHQIPEDDISEESHPPTWKAEGSLYSPETFQDMLKARRTRSSAMGNIAESSRATPDDDSYDDPGANSIFVNRSTDTPDKPARSVRVPTITLSNSTAVMPMPLSLESSQCIASLATRRGLKGPAPLDLPAPSANLSADGLYPGIPTPFLGSPSGYSPTFEFAENPSDFSLDLITMCRDLRSRCPPLHPPSPPRERPSTPTLPLSDSDSSDSPVSDADSDDWAFAKDLMATHGMAVTAEVLKGGHEDLPDATLQEGDSFSLDSAPTLTNSPLIDDDTPEASTSSIAEPGTRDSTQQRRRRTVIIETPRNSMCAKPARITVDLSHLADTDDSTAAGATFDTPLPLETPDFMSLLQSTPPSRPTSSATLRPIRSILKTREKKRVRFSLMPGPDDDDADDLHSAFDDDDTSGDARGRERAATIPQCRRSASPHHSRLSAPSMFSPADRVSFPRHPAAKSLKRRGAEPDATPTPPSKSAKTRRSLPLVPRAVDKAEVGAPKALSSRAARRSMPAETKKSTGKRGSADENAGRRHSEDGKFGAKTGSPPKSRMPFRAILGKFRV